jgi:hypothetical protein
MGSDLRGQALPSGEDIFFPLVLGAFLTIRPDPLTTSTSLKNKCHQSVIKFVFEIIL